MRKTIKALFMMGLMASPFIFTACEKDHGTTDYDDVDDDDWKKKGIVAVENNVNEVSTIEYSVR